jgi:hypothetical protein
MNAGRRSEPGFLGFLDYQDFSLPRRRRLFARRGPVFSSSQLLIFLSSLFLASLFFLCDSIIFPAAISGPQIFAICYFHLRKY